MADTTGKQTPQTDPKADAGATGTAAGKSGAVKPPVLEGTAKAAPGAKPADSTRSANPSSKTERPSTAPGETSQASSAGRAWLAGLLGGVIGLGAAYGLAWYGLWPASPQLPPPADPRLSQFATAIPELETVTGTVQDELSTLSNRVAALETAESDQPSAPDLSGLASAEDLAALAARIDNISSQGPDTAAVESLAAIEDELTALRTSSAQTSALLAEARAEIAALTESADTSDDTNLATARLPLIFSSLESAFAAGRPFETELAALRRAQPDLLVPEAIAGQAATGLPQPDAVQNRFAAVLPDMLAGRPADADANWQDAATDWFRGLVAMRPTGAVEGTSPDAIIARLETAIAARDFVTAEAELNALPEPMRAAAGNIASDIAQLAAAEVFLTQLRQNALTGENGA
ncbi:hypothetical protein [Devosia sp. XK-2]|uniref:COG4223 family protein n=1 Tax=Devosia sp. XK-2 TaxID=3126689 RepID=UPI0030D57FC1